uniref:F-box associated beta-propeller type 3 domain-containing protein n=1 Tax=Oryza glumipatula TaxID=40148 RepID=A0A0E0AGY1_9ORYZ
MLHPLCLWVLNPATGVTVALPKNHSDEIAAGRGMMMYHGKVESHAFGKISSTGVYKALRIIRFYQRQLCEVIAVDGNNQDMWRKMQGPPATICCSKQMRCVVVDGVVYFMMEFYTTYFEIVVLPVEPGSIASFYLETEKWMTVQGPEVVHRHVQDGDSTYSELNLQLSLADSGGCLVTVHNIPPIRMDLWFLTDSETGMWVKKFSLPSQFIIVTVHPLLVLDDGRVYTRSVNKEFRSEDPGTGTCATSVVTVQRSVSVPPGTKILAVGSSPIQRLVEFGTGRYQLCLCAVPRGELRWKGKNGWTGSSNPISAGILDRSTPPSPPGSTPPTLGAVAAAAAGNDDIDAAASGKDDIDAATAAGNDEFAAAVACFNVATATAAGKDDIDAAAAGKDDIDAAAAGNDEFATAAACFNAAAAGKDEFDAAAAACFNACRNPPLAAT